MSELEYDSNWATELTAAGITPPTNPINLRGVIKAILNHFSSGTITTIESTDSSVTVTNGTGPTVNLTGAGDQNLASPTFTGTVTMPDGSTWGSGGMSTEAGVTQSIIGDLSVNALTSIAGFSGGVNTLTSGAANLASPTTYSFFSGLSGTRIMSLPAVVAPLINDGQLFYCVNHSTGTVSLNATPFLFFPTGCTGTFTLSITGFTTTAAQTVGVSAGSLQTLLSDGTHGPAGTIVTAITDPGEVAAYVITIPGGLTITGNFTGVSGGSPGIATCTIDGQPTRTMPGKSATWVVCDNSNWYTLGTLAHASDTSQNTTITTPTPSTGAAFIPSANQNCELSFVVNTTATFTVTYGPSTGAEHTLITSISLPAGTYFSHIIPAGWSVVITGTIADLSNIQAATC